MSVAIVDLAGSELWSEISSLLRRRECGTTAIEIIIGYFIDNNKDQANERIFLGKICIIYYTLNFSLPQVFFLQHCLLFKYIDLSMHDKPMSPLPQNKTSRYTGPS